MARIDSPIPSTHWQNGLRLRTSAWSGTRAPSPPTVLRTLDQTGDVAPDQFPPSWSLHLGIPDTLGDPEVRILANGFELYYGGMGRSACVRCLMTEDGRWTGEADIELQPTLFSPEVEATEENGITRVESQGKVSALAVEQEAGKTRFCLCVDSPAADTAADQAKTGIPTDLDTRWDQETSLRKRFWSTYAEFDIPAEVLRTALETLVYHLEPTADGGLYSAASLPLLPEANANALYPLVEAWSAIDPSVATRLLESTLARIGDDGILPAAGPREDGSADECAWPMLVQTCLLHQQRIPESDLATRSIPQLETHLIATIERADPEHRGLPVWGSAAESFIPDAYDDQVASAALAALLLREIDAFFKLIATQPDADEKVPFLESVQDRLIGNLSTTLWDESQGICVDRYLDGEPISRATLSGFLPVGVERLPNVIQTALLRTMNNPAYFGGGPGLPLWQPWEADENTPPAPSAHQLFVLPALAAHPAAAAELEERCADSVLHWYEAHGSLPLELRTGYVEPTDPAAPIWYESPVMAACLALRTLIASRKRKLDTALPPYLVALETHRFTILIAVIAVIVGIVTASMVFDHRAPIDEEQQTESLQLVRNLMTQKDYLSARVHLDGLLAARGASPELAFIDGNLLFHQGNYTEAILRYRRCVEEGIATPKADMNLGLSLYHAGRLNDAVDQYEKVIDAHSEDYPGVQKLAETAIRIIRTYGDSLLESAPAEEPAPAP